MIDILSPMVINLIQTFLTSASVHHSAELSKFFPMSVYLCNCEQISLPRSVTSKSEQVFDTTNDRSVSISCGDRQPRNKSILFIILVPRNIMACLKIQYSIDIP